MVHLITKHYIFLAALLLILSLTLAAPVAGATVRTLNPGDSIQNNITVAESGDTLVLNPGTYNEHSITISKDITIQANTSSGGTAENTIIDAEGAGRVFTNNAGSQSLAIDGLTLMNGNISTSSGGCILSSNNPLSVTSSVFINCSSTNYGGAIYNNYDTTITSSRFLNNSATNGAAIGSHNGNFTIESSTFSDGKTSNGGAIAIYQGSLDITSSSFMRNSAIYSGGDISVSGASNCTITSSRFSNSSVTQFGGSIGTHGGTFEITNSSFSFCSAGINGGVLNSDGNANATFISSTFTGCTAGSYGGGAISNQDSNVTVRFSRIDRSTDAGGFVLRSYSGTLDAADNWWGMVTDPDSVVYASGGSIITTPYLVLSATPDPVYINQPDTSTVRVNLTRDSDGTDTASGSLFVPDGIPVAFAITSGPGLIAPPGGNLTSGSNTSAYTPTGDGASTISVTVDGRTVNTEIVVGAKSVLTLNPGDSIQQNISALTDGGTIILNPGMYTEYNISVLRNITITANASAGGSAENTLFDAQGAGRIFYVSKNRSFAIDNISLRNAYKPTKVGGAIAADTGTSLFVTSCRFFNCSARSGGGIYTLGNDFSISSTSFTDCSAGEYGGAIGTAAQSTIARSSFSNCSATNYGGGIAIFSDTAVTGSTFTSCSAANGGGIIMMDSSNTITSSAFANCSASDSGSAIYNYGGPVTIRFTRFHENYGTAAVVNDGGTSDAAENWWGTNSDPSGSATGGVTTDPWLVLNITAEPTSISGSQTALIRINLTNTSTGTDTMSGGIFVPDGIPVDFARTSGTGSIAPQDGTITTGTNMTTFTPAGAGTSTVSATVDGLTVSTGIVVTTSGTPDTVGVFRPSETKFILKDGTHTINITFGQSTDIPVSGDWNGNGITEVGVHRPAVQKFVLKNGTERTVILWGLPSDTGVAGDWNGDGMGDIGVFRSSLQKFVLKNGTVKTIIKWGLPTDKPVTGDWNGDGLWDIGVFRPSTHQFLLKNGTEKTILSFGESTDLPVTWDWNGDGLWDVGVFRPSTQQFLLKDGTETITIAFGESTDLPVTGKWR